MFICVFEDNTVTRFYPLTYLRAQFQLRAGLYTLGERIVREFPEYQPVYLSRPYLNPLLREQGLQMLAPFGLQPDEKVFFVNGALLDVYTFQKKLPEMRENFLMVHEDRLVAALLEGDLAQEAAYYLLEQNIRELLDRMAGRVDCIDVQVNMAAYPWDLIKHNADIVRMDFEHLVPQMLGTVDDKAVLYNKEAIHTGKGSRIDAMVVLDARHGPIYIDEGVNIEPFSYIQGPTYIGVDTRIVGGQIREGTSLGPVCRIGGEVEESIIQGYSNKYHAGFLGHSYLGEWVNIGAIGTNSDLKNTYGTIRVDVDSVQVDTGLQKFGILVGDHAKLGIGSMIMAGTKIGVGSNVMGESVPNIVPSFLWRNKGTFAEYRVEKCIEVAQMTMSRRNMKLSPIYANLLNHIFHLTAEQRQPILT